MKEVKNKENLLINKDRKFKLPINLGMVKNIINLEMLKKIR